MFKMQISSWVEFISCDWFELENTKKLFSNFFNIQIKTIQNSTKLACHCRLGTKRTGKVEVFSCD